MQRHTRQNCWPIYKRILQSTDWPILAGPWRSELGFEALYWIPFLQALGIPPRRLIPISRGGAAALYGSPGGFELYSMRTPKEVRIENLLQQQRTGSLKQAHVTAFDRAVIKDAAKELGLTRYHVLHPAWMYQTLVPYWSGQRGLEWIWPRVLKREQTDHGPELSLGPLPAPEVDTTHLPAHFVAVRFYARSTYPYNEQGMVCARETIKQLAERMPVVLLHPGVHADEHVDLPCKDIPNVLKLSDLFEVTPENNLAIQAAVMKKAQGFVGTYGGLAQLALRLGKPTISFYQQWLGTALAHKYLADAMATAMHVPCLVLRVGEVPLLRSVLPALQPTQSSSGVTQKAFVPRAKPAEQTV